MRKSAGRCLKMVFCDGELHKVQQKHNDKYYLGYECLKCGDMAWSLSQKPRSSPWKNVPEGNYSSVKSMRGLEKLCRQ
ncbi:MAG: hypothetical protein Q8Q89_04990 [bacterium]|nr:hypothetical protein [bacterium]